MKYQDKSQWNRIKISKNPKVKVYIKTSYYEQYENKSKISEFKNYQH